MVERVLPENKWVRYGIFLAYDVCVVLLSSFLSLWVRFDLSLQAIPALSYSFVGIVSTVRSVRGRAAD